MVGQFKIKLPFQITIVIKEEQIDQKKATKEQANKK